MSCGHWVRPQSNAAYALSCSEHWSVAWAHMLPFVVLLAAKVAFSSSLNTARTAGRLAASLVSFVTNECCQSRCHLPCFFCLDFGCRTGAFNCRHTGLVKQKKMLGLEGALVKEWASCSTP